MLRVLKKGLFLSVMALGLAIAIQSFSHATPLQIFLTDGVTLVTVNDGGLNDIIGGVNGAVGFSGQIGTWTVNVTTGITYPVLGSQSKPQLDLNSVNTSSSSGGFLLVGVSALGYTSAPGPVTFEIGGTTSGIVVATAFSGDNTYYTPNLADLSDFTGLNQFAVVSFTSGAFMDSVSGSIPGSPNPYALGMVVGILHGDGESRVTSFDGLITAGPVPEPATMLLLGSGLIGLAGLARRKFRK